MRLNRNASYVAEEPTEKAKYKRAKGEEYLIIKAKRDLLDKLLPERDNDLWDVGYNITERHLGNLTPLYNTPTERKL